jgi:conjugal transfer pilus assembly protein TraE
MQVNDFKKRWSNLNGENRFYRTVIYGLVAILAVEAFYLFKKESIVVMQPWTLTEQVELQSSKSSRSYQESWALALSELLGNVTPTNVDFVIERIKPLLSPAIYNDVVRNAQEQALFLKEDRISQTFEPRGVEFEKSTGKVFVHGYFYVTGTATGISQKDAKPVRSEATFEFKIKISQYMPVIESVQVYAGTSRTKRTLERLEVAQKRQAERAARDKDEEK